jgi:hypothetical protein
MAKNVNMDIEQSAAEAVRVITQAAEVAATRLASATDDATKLVFTRNNYSRLTVDNRRQNKKGLPLGSPC